MGFTRAELESFRGRSISDLMPEHPRLVFVGINPGLWTAATGIHFAHPGNRFYPALVRAGIIPRLPEIADDGLPEADRRMFLDAGIDAAEAKEIVLNAKMQRPGVCNALECLLVDATDAARLLPSIAEALLAKGCELRGDALDRKRPHAPDLELVE